MDISPGILGSRTVNVHVCVLNLAPVDVILHTVNRQGDHLHISLRKLSAQLGGAGQLSGADGGEVPRVGKQDAPPAGQTHTHTQKKKGGICSWLRQERRGEL